MSATTTTAAAASTLPASTALSTTASSSQLGLCLTNPTTAYVTTYGTGIKAAALVAAPFVFSGAAILAVALLSYAVTKAAIDPA